MGSVHQVALLGFKPDASKEDLAEFRDGLLAMKERCIWQDTKKQYITSMLCGIDHSVEKLQGGATHVVVIEFESQEARDYYMKDDPDHLALAAVGDKVLAHLQVLTFVPGVFPDF
ncbi:hypothetical protein PT974_11671 [Cladobotryum mycophilum]|uniref:Stress-response A/B barrel domain-containing protein n=1 Tax=Cladobotryum mycophilum TaxID=491253 RepID=A0ABR0S5V3_9HYPO